MKAVIPGSFDPVTLGHLDIIRRAAEHFDGVTVAVLENPGKEPLFGAGQRLDLIRKTVVDLGNLEIESFRGLLVDFCRSRGIRVIVKGLRAVSDFEYELQMAQMNRRMADVETFFMSTSPEYSYLSSSLVKEVARLGGPLDGVVPAPVEEALRARFEEVQP